MPSDKIPHHPWRLQRVVAAWQASSRSRDEISSAGRDAAAALPLERAVPKDAVVDALRLAALPVIDLENGRHGSPVQEAYVHLGRDRHPSPYGTRGYEGVYAKMSGDEARCLLVVSADVPEAAGLPMPFDDLEENLRQQTRLAVVRARILGTSIQSMTDSIWASSAGLPIQHALSAMAGGLAPADDPATESPMVEDDVLRAMLAKLDLTSDDGVRLRLCQDLERCTRDRSDASRHRIVQLLDLAISGVLGYIAEDR